MDQGLEPLLLREGVGNSEFKAHRLLYHDAGPFLVYIYYDPPTDIRVRVEVYVHVVHVRIKEAGDDQGARGVDFHSFQRLREGIMAPSPGTNFVPNIGTRP